jgi:hypothetical protein
MNRLVEGPYDIVIVATDVALLSRTRRFVPGLASPVSRVAVVSTHKLMAGPRDEPVQSLDTPAVRWNAATLLLHLLGHVLGAQHGSTDGGVMDPFEFDPSRRGTPDFDADAESYLHRIGQRIPEEESSRGRLARVDSTASAHFETRKKSSAHSVVVARSRSRCRFRNWRRPRSRPHW